MSTLTVPANQKDYLFPILPNVKGESIGCSTLNIPDKEQAAKSEDILEVRITREETRLSRFMNYIKKEHITDYKYNFTVEGRDSKSFLNTLEQYIVPHKPWRIIDLIKPQVLSPELTVRYHLNFLQEDVTDEAKKRVVKSILMGKRNKNWDGVLFGLMFLGMQATLGAICIYSMLVSNRTDTTDAIFGFGATGVWATVLATFGRQLSGNGVMYDSLMDKVEPEDVNCGVMYDSLMDKVEPEDVN